MIWENIIIFKSDLERDGLRQVIPAHATLLEQRFHDQTRSGNKSLLSVKKTKHFDILANLNQGRSLLQKVLLTFSWAWNSIM